MTIQVVHEHSVCVSMLAPHSRILDAGCRDFEFTNAFRNLGHQVTAIDIGAFNGNYLRVGLSTTFKSCFISDDKDPQANKLSETGRHKINAVPLSELERIAGGKFDLIKLDIEGEELPVLASLKHPIAKQISVEFHAHCGQTKQQLDELLDWLSEWYSIHNRIWEERHGAGFNYWDILLCQL